LEFGGAEGGGDDLAELQSAIESFARQGISDADNVQQATLLGAWRAATLLRRHKSEWDAVTRALTDGQTDVVSCIRAIETSQAK